jgi:hypothetical protein
MYKEEDLQMEGPGMHIGVEVCQIGIICHRFISGPPAEPGADPFCQGSLSYANVPRYNDEMLCHVRLNFHCEMVANSG